MGMNTRVIFFLGAVTGLAVASVIYYLFSIVVLSPSSNLIMSGVTLVGIGSAIGGYYSHWRGDRSLRTYFVLGLGAGIVVIAFVGVGNGVSPAYYG